MVKLNVLNLEKSEYKGGKSSLCPDVDTIRYQISLSKQLGKMGLNLKE